MADTKEQMNRQQPLDAARQALVDAERAAGEAWSAVTASPEYRAMEAARQRLEHTAIWTAYQDAVEVVEMAEEAFGTYEPQRCEGCGVPFRDGEGGTDGECYSCTEDGPCFADAMRGRSADPEEEDRG